MDEGMSRLGNRLAGFLLKQKCRREPYVEELLPQLCSGGDLTQQPFFSANTAMLYFRKNKYVRFQPSYIGSLKSKRILSILT